jgi:hypothetical protein
VTAVLSELIDAIASRPSRRFLATFAVKISCIYREKSQKILTAKNAKTFRKGRRENLNQDTAVTAVRWTHHPELLLFSTGPFPRSSCPHVVQRQQGADPECCGQVSRDYITWIVDSQINS